MSVPGPPAAASAPDEVPPGRVALGAAGGDVTLDAGFSVALGDFSLRTTLAITSKEVVAVVGPNGAGKSTLLRVLAGLLPADEGRIVLGGLVLDDAFADIFLAPEERPIGLVFQDHLLFPHLTVLDNVAFGMRSAGVGRRRARTQALEVLGELGAGDLASRQPATLSGGQAQRVALARALIRRPQLLLLDEPFAALDASARGEVRRELRQRLTGFDGVKILVTHDPVEAMSLATRIVVLEEGAVVQSGSPSDVSSRPRSRYVADLVGVNLFEGLGAGDKVALPGGQSLAAPGAGRGRVLAVIHPRAVALHLRPPEGTPRNNWPATVDAVDFEGDRVRVRLAGSVPLVAEVTPAALAELSLAEGSPVWASVKATEVDVYPG